MFYIFVTDRNAARKKEMEEVESDIRKMILEFQIKKLNESNPKLSNADKKRILRETKNKALEAIQNLRREQPKLLSKAKKQDATREVINIMNKKKN